MKQLLALFLCCFFSHLFAQNALTISLGQDITICQGKSQVLNAAVQGGSAPYTYIWSHDTATNPEKSSFTSVSPFVTKTYFVTVTDAQGTTASDDIIVVVNSSPTVSVTPNTTICFNESVALNVTVNGGKSPFSYTWNPTAGLSASNFKSPIATPNATTTYSVTVSDVNGCSNTASMTITVNPRPTANAGSDVTICAQASTALTAVSEGGTTPYTYAWTPNNGTLSSTSIANPVASPTVTTTYTLLVSDSNGCTSRDEVEVTVNPRPTVNAGADVSICTQASTALTAVGSGGTAGYNYLWSPSTGLSTSITASVTTSPTETTTYTVTLTDSKGCTNTDQVVVTVQSKPTVSVTPNTTICFNESVALDVIVNGGTSPFSYTWNPTAGLSSGFVKNPVATPNATTTYNVTVSDVNGCSNTASMTITVNPRPTANAGADVTICKGGCTQLKADVIGGTQPYTYSWSPSTGLSAASTASVTTCPAATTTYTVIVSDINGCTNFDEVVVYVEPIRTSADITICSGTLTELTVHHNNLQYLWSNNATTKSIMVSPSVTTTYGVSVSNGCWDYKDIKVTVLSNQGTPMLLDIGADITVCSADTLEMKPMLSGGSAPYSYEWTNNGSFQILDNKAKDTKLTFKSAGNAKIDLRVTDAKGCMIDDYKNIAVKSSPEIQSRYSLVNGAYYNAICKGQSTVLDLTVNPPTGLEYAWVGEGLSANNILYPIIKSNKSGTYNLKIKDKEDCSADATFFLDVLSCDKQISGLAFADINENCLFDKNNDYVGGLKVEAMGRKLQRSAFAYPKSADAIYAMQNLISDIYDVSISNSKDNNCGALPKVYTVDLTQEDSATNINFARQVSKNVDVKIALIPSQSFRPGFNASYTINFCNIGGNQNPQSGKIVLTFDKNLKNIASNITYLSRTDKTMTWEYEDLKPNECRTIIFYFTFPMPAEGYNAGKIIEANAEIINNNWDSDATNNVANNKTALVNSYDPNDKTASPMRNANGDILETDKKLTYTIRFQNTGNAPAIRVLIEDDIDTKTLDISSLRLESTSHAVKINRRNNTIQFIFDDINLADSVHNEPESHGFVQFSIKRFDLPIGTAIKNKAAIFFDYNLPIITNTTNSTIRKRIVQSEDLVFTKIQVFPNPSHDGLFTLNFDNQNIMNFEVVDIFGKTIMQKQQILSNSSIDLSNCPKGIYFLNLLTIENGRIYCEKLVRE